MKKRILPVLLSVVLLMTDWLHLGTGIETAWANQAEAPENLLANGSYEQVNDNGWAKSWVSY
ncbi:hypothetical protein PAT3040_03025, partial [Paenibacillus agaridevorans]